MEWKKWIKIIPEAAVFAVYIIFRVYIAASVLFVIGTVTTTQELNMSMFIWVVITCGAIIYVMWPLLKYFKERR